MRLQVIVAGILALMGINPALGQTPGYYRDIFVDGGVHLTSMIDFPAAEAMGLEIEYLSTDVVTMQNAAMIGDAKDSNGHLLYPDGEPRFRLLYTNGGSSTNHGSSLGPAGRDRVRSFYRSGGSFMGSCAGAFISSVHWDSVGVNASYYHIWPGRTGRTRLLDSYTDHDIPRDSPLLQYSDFGNDLKIANVRHNGGCWANEELDFPKHTEILARYDIPYRATMHGKASTWAYKPDDDHGRIVVIGSHPEFVREGEIFDLTDAMLRYALDGVGTIKVKAELLSGEPRVMDRLWEDNEPEFTRIGDKQYHHYILNVPANAKQIHVDLDAEDGFDFNLFLKPGSIAFADGAWYSSTDEQSDHTLEVSLDTTLQWKKWYIGVECATTISAAGAVYWGQTDVLNGISYSITATWDTTGVVSIADAPLYPTEFRLNQNYPNPFNPSTTISYSIPEISDLNLIIYDVSGRIILTHSELQKDAGRYNITWNGLDAQGLRAPTGVYFARLQVVDPATGGAGKFNQTIKMLLLN